MIRRLNSGSLGRTARGFPPKEVLSLRGRVLLHGLHFVCLVPTWSRGPNVPRDTFDWLHHKDAVEQVPDVRPCKLNGATASMVKIRPLARAKSVIYIESPGANKGQDDVANVGRPVSYLTYPYSMKNSILAVILQLSFGY